MLSPDNFLIVLRNSRDWAGGGELEELINATLEHRLDVAVMVRKGGKGARHQHEVHN